MSSKLKKREVRINDDVGKGGYYVDHFKGETLVATKVCKDKKLVRHYRNLIKNAKDFELSEEEVQGMKLTMTHMYEWVFGFDDNPHMKGVLKRNKAQGLDESWTGVSCPIWLATEVEE